MSAENGKIGNGASGGELREKVEHLGPIGSS